MKRVTILLLPLLLLLVGCNLQDRVENKAPTPQLQPTPPLAESCQECKLGCILGYDFTSTNIDGNHPQGGYKIILVRGGCECTERNGSWYAATRGPSTIQIGQTGGPGSGSIVSLAGAAYQTWGFSCSPTSGFGGILENLGNWEEWLTHVGETHAAENSNLPLVIHNNPPDWGIEIVPGSDNASVQVAVSKPDQAAGLIGIRIKDNDDNNTLVEIPGTGAYSYNLDLSDFSNGAYVFELEFDQGFTLGTTLEKVTE